MKNGDEIPAKVLPLQHWNRRELRRLAKHNPPLNNFMNNLSSPVCVPRPRRVGGLRVERVERVEGSRLKGERSEGKRREGCGAVCVCAGYER
eukprot:2343808-Rhodomonas_salina.1